MPRHIAFIMDGNGRWATARGLERGEGHIAGVKAVREVVETCSDLGVECITLYSFSTENWKRPAGEVRGLMELFAKTVAREIKGLQANQVRLRILGRLGDLPAPTRLALEQAEKMTANNTGMTLALAVNYGSRQEITDAVRTLAARVERGELAAANITEDEVAAALYTHDLPDPDLLIRTTGELRISNYLLWQIAYSEIYVTDTLWPDFDRYELARALLAFGQRNRRFGGVS